MYASVADMVNRFGEQDLVLLSWREGVAEGVINTPVVEQALADATAEINGYIGGRYKLPLSAVPAVLSGHCCSIARYLLNGDRAPEQVTDRYKAVIKFLEAVGKGDLQLGLADDQVTQPSGTIAIMQSEGLVFSRRNGRGFI
jgi:phage gp36-like protein